MLAEDDRRRGGRLGERPPEERVRAPHHGRRADQEDAGKRGRACCEPTARYAAASARRSSIARPNRFSRRSKRPGPERRAVDVDAEAHRGREPVERADEHRQLEVDLRDAARRRGDAGALEDRLPGDELARAGLAVPRAALGLVGLRARAGSGRAAPRGRSARSRPARRPAGARPGAAPACRGRARRAPSTRAGGRRRARRPRRRAAARSRAGRSRRPSHCSRDHVGPVGPLDLRGAQTSTSTGRIIGRRAGAVVDELADAVVQVLLQQLDLGDAARRGTRAARARLPRAARLSISSARAEAAEDQLGRARAGCRSGSRGSRR